MDIRHLQYILEVVRWNSFTKAADALHVTQPTISKTIKNMEEELGFPLFIRSGKKVELTDAGQVLLAQAHHIVHSFDNMMAELTDLTNFRKGRIRIGLPPMVGSSFFPRVMSRFRERYPGLTIHMVEEGSKRLETAVEEGSLDVAVVLLPTQEEAFDSFSFVEDSLRLVLHPDHPLAVRQQVSLAELAEESFVLFSEGFALHDRVIQECIQVGFQPRILHESSQWDFISEMVAANLGIAFLPETICNTLNRDRVRTVPLVGPVIPWHLAMIWRRDGYLSYAAREWIRFTKKLLLEPSRGSL